MTREEFIRQIPAKEMVYVIYSGFTKAPYVSCNEETFDDEVLIYTDEETAVQEAKRMTEQKQDAFVAKVEKQNLLKTFTIFHLYGINAMVFIHDGDRFTYQLEEIVSMPDRAAVPENQRPLENPRLQLCMLYFMQEVRRKLEKPDMAALKELEEEMFVNVARSKYLIPFQETEQDGKKQMQMIFIQLANGTPMVPVFTDSFEFARFQGKQNQLKVTAAGFENLVALPMPEKVGGFLINPAGVGVPLTKEWLQRMKKN